MCATATTSEAEPDSRNAESWQRMYCCYLLKAVKANLEDTLQLQAAFVRLLVLDPSEQQLPDLCAAAHVHVLCSWHLGRCPPSEPAHGLFLVFFCLHFSCSQMLPALNKCMLSVRCQSADFVRGVTAAEPSEVFCHDCQLEWSFLFVLSVCFAGM